MDLTDELRAHIDGLPYESMLRRWRFSHPGDPMFQGDSGEYFGKVMAAKRNADPEGAVRASKNLGW